MARAAVPALGIAALLAATLGLDRYSNYPEQLGLGVLVALVFVTALTRVPVDVRVQALGVVCFATIGEVTGSLIWGVYHYRLHNLPLFVPPAHGIVYLTGLSVAAAFRGHARLLVVCAATLAFGWGLAGLLRGRNRAIYAAVFLVVASLELYGTAIGTWRWERELPGLGIRDGNPPSGVASGYVWFDVMALLTAPLALSFLRSRRAGRTQLPAEPPRRGPTPA